MWYKFSIEFKNVWLICNESPSFSEIAWIINIIGFISGYGKLIQFGKPKFQQNSAIAYLIILSYMCILRIIT